MLAPIPLLDWKAVFRRRAKEARAKAAASQPGAPRFAAAAFMEALDPAPSSAVALYAAKGDELDTAPLAKALAERGVAVLLPVVTGRGQPLVFRLFEVDRGLADGPYGIQQPPADAPVMRPDVVVTPLLAAREADGARLGMGGGYYDRTIAQLRGEGAVTVVGYGYATQLIARFPTGPEDQPLDWFVSERGAKRWARG